MASIRKVNGSYYARFYDRTRQPKRKTWPLRVSEKRAASVVRSYVMDNTVSVATRKNRRRHVRAFLAWAVGEDLVDANAADDVPVPKGGRPEPEVIRPEQIDRILAAITAHEQLQRQEPGRNPDDAWLALLVRVGIAAACGETKCSASNGATLI